MIKVVNIVKEGNKVKYYDCISDNRGRASFTKAMLIQHINAGNVENAKIQVYKNQTIIRVKDTSKNAVNSKPANKIVEQKQQKQSIRLAKIMQSNVLGEVIREYDGSVETRFATGMNNWYNEECEREMGYTPDICDADKLSSAGYRLISVESARLKKSYGIEIDFINYEEKGYGKFIIRG